MCNRKTKFQELNTVSESESSLLPNEIIHTFFANSQEKIDLVWFML